MTTERDMAKEIYRLETVTDRQNGRIIGLERQNAKLRAALTHIAGIAPVTDAQTGYADDSCQATACAALQTP